MGKIAVRIHVVMGSVANQEKVVVMVSVVHQITIVAVMGAAVKGVAEVFVENMHTAVMISFAGDFVVNISTAAISQVAQSVDIGKKGRSMKKREDQKLGELYTLGDKLFVYIHASRTKMQDSYGNYIFPLDDERYLYCDPSATVDGRAVPYEKTIVHLIDQNIEAFENKIHHYSRSDSQLAQDLQKEIKGIVKQIDAVGGNMHKLWADADPSYFDPHSKEEKNPFRIEKLLYHTHSLLSILINYPSDQGRKYVD